MDKRELAILEKAYAAEVESALSHSGIHIMQTKSKLAQKLVDDGLLRKSSVRLNVAWPCTVEGYELTESGRFAYCTSC